MNRASNKAFDLLTKENKVNKKVNASKQSITKCLSIVETSLVKDKKLDWINKVENNIKTKRISKLLLFPKSKDNKETCINLAHISALQVNISQVNKTIMTSHVNKSTLQDTDSLGQNSLMNTVTNILPNNMIKEASNSDLIKNSDNSEVKENNNIEEVTFTTVTSKKCKKKNKLKTGNLTLENAKSSPNQSLKSKIG
ncbi:149_t:CDS:2 [Cetraspora pellucida]|uniref:149_t:CDS:1 n=1 Tax=Cetraspora pellucida TaxID=1433469 RepID=A0ACA9K0P0_9GLOM|nr:149_t:CDS:2 [Cetraspora pellucida]